MAPPETASNGITQSQLSSGLLRVVGFLIRTFTDFERRREPPRAGKVHHVRLITITTSHYCEKVRWVLDLVESDTSSPFYYTEDPHPPLLHAFASVEASCGLSSQTPCVLVDDRGDSQDTDFINESATIQRRFLESAYPPEIGRSVQTMEDYFDAHLGPPVRCLLNCYLLLPCNRSAAIRAGARETTKIEQCLFSILFPLVIRPKLHNLLDISAESAAACQQSIRDIFDVVSHRLLNNEEGDSYIMDTPCQSYGLTAADLTFAALASPLLEPAEHPLKDDSSNSTSELSHFRTQLRNTVAGRHALRMYKEHRYPAESHVGGIKCVDRNKNMAGCWPFV